MISPSFVSDITVLKRAERFGVFFSNFSNIGDKSDISRDAKATKKLLSEQHQVWWDDAETLSIKYDTALRAGVEFVGVWTVNMVDDHPEIAKALWSVLPHRNHNRSKAKMKP